MKPEEDGVAKARQKHKKDSRKRYTKAWIGFADKRVAKAFVNYCNGETMKGKRRSRFYHDIWCLKYLKGFRWTHLKEELAYHSAMQERKRAEELSRIGREKVWIDQKNAQAE